MKRDKRRRTANGPVRLDRIAETLLDPVVSRAGFSSTQIIASWPEIVGPELATRSRPEKLRWPKRRDDPDSGLQDGATLVIRAEGIDALEIQHMTSNIVARINTIFGWRAVTRILIRQGPVSGRDEPPKRRETGDLDAAKSVAGEKLETVVDDGLRAALARLGSRIAGDTKV